MNRIQKQYDFIKSAQLQEESVKTGKLNRLRDINRKVEEKMKRKVRVTIYVKISKTE